MNKTLLLTLALIGRINVKFISMRPQPAGDQPGCNDQPSCGDQLSPTRPPPAPVAPTSPHVNKPTVNWPTGAPNPQDGPDAAPEFPDATPSCANDGE